MIVDHVAIVGSGFSGTLLAINLLRHGMRRVTLIERDASRLARGLAYGKMHADHVLNVRAGNMSAFPDEPQHFVQWLARRGLGSESSFATRGSYGSYLAELLADAQHMTGDRLRILTDEAIELALEGDRARAKLKSGGAIEADVAVLAPGNLPPHTLPAFAGLGRPLYADDPWADDITAGLNDRDDILLLGNGLTAVDCALSLTSSGYGGRIMMLSRRGLSPHSHAAQPPGPPLAIQPENVTSSLVRSVRMRAGAVGWRNAIDELRPFTQFLWRAADEQTRSRFLRHLRPFWDIHRHRLAPQITERLEAMRASGRLTARAGKIIGAVPERDGLRIAWRSRGEDQPEGQLFKRVINCTGPLGDLTRTSDPLLANLYGSGLVRPDALAIGIDVDQQGRALSRGGHAQKRLFVVGPMTRGAHWEVVAVPDIRRQVWDRARYLTNSHWVGMEEL